MNGEEIIAKLKELGEKHEFQPGQIVNHQVEDDVLQTIKDCVGDFYQVSYERTGSDYDRLQIVYKFEDHGVYLALHAYYSSWDDSDFADSTWEEVEPIAAIIYEPVRKKNGKA